MTPSRRKGRRRLGAVTDAGAALVLDNDGIAKAATDRTVYLTLIAAQRRDAPVITSAAVLAELMRGTDRDHEFHRVLSGGAVRVEHVTQQLATEAGHLIGAARLASSEAVDAMVAATALEYARRSEAAGVSPDVLVLTSDKGHVPRLLEGRQGIAVQLV